MKGWKGGRMRRRKGAGEEGKGRGARGVGGISIPREFFYKLIDYGT